jgi:hypothetical protein
VQRADLATHDTVTVDDLRSRIATIEALMFACDVPPILITLVEDLYQSIDRLPVDRPPFRPEVVGGS